MTFIKVSYISEEYRGMNLFSTIVWFPWSVEIDWSELRKELDNA